MRRIFTISLILLSFTAFAGAQKAVVPIVYLTTVETGGKAYINDGSLLGGIENGKYLDAKTTFARLKGGEKYSLFSFADGKKGVFSLGEVEKAGIMCPENFSLSPKLEASADFAVGANAGWEVVARKPKEISAKNAKYKKAVAEILRLRGMAKSPAKVDSAYRVDLDGDGVDEVLLAASHYIADTGEGAKPGSYTFLMIQKTVGGKVRNLLVGGDFVKKTSGYFEGDYWLLGVADLNGDGKTEIFVHVAGYEENGLKVYELKSGKPTEIKALAYHCGL